MTGPLIAPLQMERMRSHRCHHAPAPPVSLEPQWGSAPLAWDHLCQRGQWRGEGLSCLLPVCPLILPASSYPLGAPCSTNGLSSISHEYLKGSYALDLEAVKGGATSLPHLNKTLVTSCKRLHR